MKDWLRLYGIVLCALLAAAVPAIARPAPAPSGATLPDPSQPLADRIETAFRTCAIQLTQRDYLTSKNATALDRLGISLGRTPPGEVKTMADRLFGNLGIYASVMAPTGAVWIATSATVPACKITVADTELALGARVAFYRQLRQTSGWTVDAAQSGRRGPILRDLLVLNAARPGSHMVTILDGPNVIADEGRGIQLIVTVAFDGGAPIAGSGPSPGTTPSAGPDASLDGQFAGALANICAAVAATGSFAEQPAVTALAAPPPAVAGYPATRWYALRAAGEKVLLSLDAAPGPPRCRVVLAGGSGQTAHQAAVAVLTRAGAQVLQPIALDARRNVMASVMVLRRTGGAILFLVQSTPVGTTTGAAFQATATAIFATEDQLRDFGVTR